MATTRQKWGLSLLMVVAWVCAIVGSWNHHILPWVDWSFHWLIAELSGHDTPSKPNIQDIHFPFDYMGMWGGISLLIAGAVALFVHSVWSWAIYRKDEYTFFGRKRNKSDKR